MHADITIQSQREFNFTKTRGSAQTLVQVWLVNKKKKIFVQFKSDKVRIKLLINMFFYLNHIVDEMYINFHNFFLHIYDSV